VALKAIVLYEKTNLNPADARLVLAARRGMPPVTFRLAGKSDRCRGRIQHNTGWNPAYR
jgi:hypothetical protein